MNQLRHQLGMNQSPRTEGRIRVRCNDLNDLKLRIKIGHGSNDKNNLKLMEG